MRDLEALFKKMWQAKYEGRNPIDEIAVVMMDREVNLERANEASAWRRPDDWEPRCVDLKTLQELQEKVALAVYEAAVADVLLIMREAKNRGCL